MSDPQGSGPGPGEELYRDFRPRAARVVTIVLGTITLLGAAAIILATPAVSGGRFGLADQVGTALLALGICWFLYRQGAVTARPGESGLAVRNLIRRRSVEWAEIVNVTLGPGDPWARLDLADGDTLPVMAIQSADGGHGRAEARRLATLVALHGPRDEGGPRGH